jgi:hypothetical protein
MSAPAAIAAASVRGVDRPQILTRTPDKAFSYHDRYSRNLDETPSLLALPQAERAGRFGERGFEPINSNKARHAGEPHPVIQAFYPMPKNTRTERMSQ